MKVKKGSKPSSFIPFTITLTIETVDEMRALYHIANHVDVLKLIKESNGYGWNDACYYDCNINLKELGYCIEEELTNQNLIV